MHWRVPDLQSAWQILLQCAGPRCHHFLRTVPPDQSARYAVGHDLGMRRAMESVLGSLPGTEQKECAHVLATMPMRLGGLGLQSARRMAPAAFWASWAPHDLRSLARVDQSCCGPVTPKGVWPSWKTRPGFSTAAGSWDVQSGMN